MHTKWQVESDMEIECQGKENLEPEIAFPAWFNDKCFVEDVVLRRKRYYGLLY